MQIKIPEKIETTLYVKLYVSGILSGNIDVSDWAGKEDDERVTLLEVPFSIDIPKDVTIESLKNAMIEKLESKKSKIQAEYYVKLQHVQNKINSLLAIEHKE